MFTQIYQIEDPKLAPKESSASSWDEDSWRIWFFENRWELVESWHKSADIQSDIGGEFIPANAVEVHPNLYYSEGIYWYIQIAGSESYLDTGSYTLAGRPQSDYYWDTITNEIEPLPCPPPVVICDRTAFAQAEVRCEKRQSIGFNPVANQLYYHQQLMEYKAQFKPNDNPWVKLNDGEYSYRNYIHGFAYEFPEGGFFCQGESIAPITNLLPAPMHYMSREYDGEYNRDNRDDWEERLQCSTIAIAIDGGKTILFYDRSLNCDPLVKGIVMETSPLAIRRVAWSPIEDIAKFAKRYPIWRPKAGREGFKIVRTDQDILIVSRHPHPQYNTITPEEFVADPNFKLPKPIRDAGNY